MLSTMKARLLVAAGFAGAAMVCPSCGGVGTAVAAPPGIYQPAADTAQVRLHISGMTCGSCATTARLALNKLAGVHSATVTLEDSLGVVRYDPRRVTPAQIASHLNRLTGYAATALPDSSASPRGSGGA